MNDYAKHWEEAFGGTADSFLRRKTGNKPFMVDGKWYVYREYTWIDREWLYSHLNGPVIDVGCGNAIDYPYLKDKGYVGVDVTQSFLKSAHETYGVPEECLVLADGRDIPMFKDKQFKSGYLKDVLLHWIQEEGIRFMRELCRVSEESYVAWGTAKDPSKPDSKVRCFLPSDKPIMEMWSDGFYYNTYNIHELEKYFKISFVGEDTTITKIELR